VLVSSSYYKVANNCAYRTFVLVVDGGWRVGLVADRCFAAPVAVALAHPLSQTNQGKPVITGVTQLGAESIERRQFVAPVEQRLRTLTA